MLKRFKWIFAFVTLALAMLSFTPIGGNYFEIAKNLDIFTTLFKEVNTYYVDEVEPGQLIRTGIDAMLESLDPYTDYIAEEELENFRIAATGQYAGIGALIGQINNKVFITHPYKGFPAFKAGIRVGDQVIAVNGRDVQTKSTTEISSLLKGQPHTEVQLTVKRHGQKSDLTFRIKRERIAIGSIAYTTLLPNQVGYVKLDDFNPGAGKELAVVIEQLKSKGATKLILDLRDNPGGLLHEAINIVNLFIPKGKEVVSTKGKVDEWNKTYKTLNHPLDTEIPLVVVTGEASASASEIVAGALQDYDRAVLIGDKTFGKGLVQVTRQLAYNSQLKVTTARYYIPSGRCIQRLDYAHRSEDGAAQEIHDSLKTAFKTHAGRKVFDGGGLDPDVTVRTKQLASSTLALINEGLIFEYASRYCNEKPAPKDFASFSITDNEFDLFIKWLNERKFDYETSLESSFNQVVELGKSDRLYSQLEAEFNSLAKKLREVKNKDFLMNRDEIKSILSRQIAFHYALNEGQLAISIPGDEFITEAVGVLKNQLRYNQILSGK